MLEVNSIRLALMRTRQLQDWISESRIRAVNLVRTNAYAKVYDAIATVLVDHNEVEFGIECERTLKIQAKYQRIREAIESERRLNAFLYLVPSYQLLYALQQAFSGTQRLVLFGMLDEFKQHTLVSRVRTAYYHEAPLQEMLARLIAARARA